MLHAGYRYVVVRIEIPISKIREGVYVSILAVDCSVVLGTGINCSRCFGTFVAGDTLDR